MNTYFIVYLIGYGLMIAAVWFGLDAAGVAQTWKIVVLLFLLGLGIVYAWSQAQTDTAQREQARGGAGADRGGGTPQQGGNPQQQGGTPQQGGNPQT
jgi:hypothetical protein